MTIHEGAFPDTITDPKVKKLLEDYLSISNASNKSKEKENEEKFAQLFAQDGVYQLASKRAQGHDGNTQLYCSLQDLAY